MNNNEEEQKSQQYKQYKVVEVSQLTLVQSRCRLSRGNAGETRGWPWGNDRRAGLTPPIHYIRKKYSRTEYSYRRR